MAEQQEHRLNRHLFIADNLNLLRVLDNESIDLICIDPPFAKNQTFTGSLRPPLSDAERQQELETLAGWGIRSQRDAENAGIEWPDADNTGRFSDIWRWEDDVHEDWVTRIENDFPALAKVIDTTRSAHSEGAAAYLTYMAIRIIEMHRVLKPTGSIYLHCDSTIPALLIIMRCYNGIQILMFSDIAHPGGYEIALEAAASFAHARRQQRFARPVC